MVVFRLLSPYRAQSTSVPVDVVKVLVAYDPDSGVRSLGATPFYSSEWNLLALWVPGRGWVYLCMWRTLNTLSPCFCVLHIIWGWDGVRGWWQSQGAEPKMFATGPFQESCAGPWSGRWQRGQARTAFLKRWPWADTWMMRKHWLWETGCGPFWEGAATLRWDEGRLGGKMEVRVWTWKTRAGQVFLLFLVPGVCVVAWQSLWPSPQNSITKFLK